MRSTSDFQAAHEELGGGWRLSSGPRCPTAALRRDQGIACCTCFVSASSLPANSRCGHTPATKNSSNSHGARWNADAGQPRPALLKYSNSAAASPRGRRVRLDARHSLSVLYQCVSSQSSSSRTEPLATSVAVALDPFDRSFTICARLPAWIPARIASQVRVATGPLRDGSTVT
jgi:hypothetical protein